MIIELKLYLKWKFEMFLRPFHCPFNYFSFPKYLVQLAWLGFVSFPCYGLIKNREQNIQWLMLNILRHFPIIDYSTFIFYLHIVRTVLVNYFIPFELMCWGCLPKILSHNLFILLFRLQLLVPLVHRSPTRTLLKEHHPSSCLQKPTKWEFIIMNPILSSSWREGWKIPKINLWLQNRFFISESSIWTVDGDPFLHWFSY